MAKVSHEKLKNRTIEEDETTVVSYDVTSLFTEIPLDETTRVKQSIAPLTKLPIPQTSSTRITIGFHETTHGESHQRNCLQLQRKTL